MSKALEDLAADLGRAGDTITVRALSVITKGAVNIRDDMRTDAKGSRHFRMARSITYELTGDSTSVGALVGPVKGHAGSLANIAYFGGVNGGGGTVRDPSEPMNSEEPELVKRLEALLDEGI